MSDLVQFNPVRAWDKNGDFSPGAKAYFYEPGTTTPRVVYTDSALTTAHAVPLVANARGVFAPVFTSGQIKVNVTDADDVTLPGFPLDPAATVAADSAGADSISFDPTGEIPVSTVQAAIERVQANIETEFSDLGLGLTTAAPLLASFDVTNIPSGKLYRFDMAVTLGTGYSEWSGTAVGIFWFVRISSDSGIAFAAAGGAGVFVRRVLSAGAWGSWARVQAAIKSQADLNAGTDTVEASITAAKLEASFVYRRKRFVVEGRWASGTEGGTASSTTWHTRFLNTIVENNITGATLAANIMTLPAGRYRLEEARAPGVGVNGHQVQLYDNDATAVILNGTSAYSNAGGGVATDSVATGIFTLTAETDIILRHYCQTGAATTGLGRATNSGAGEVYGRVVITRLGD